MLAEVLQQQQQQTDEDEEEEEDREEQRSKRMNFIWLIRLDFCHPKIFN